MSDEFIAHSPTLEDYWRGIILYGRNVASYKFALATALLELRPSGGDLIKLEDLSVPFSCAVASHLKNSDKQATSRSSKFLNACREFNDGKLTEAELVAATTKLGFNNVIDAFHVVGSQPIERKFFEDERRDSGGIKITDNLSVLLESFQSVNLPAEVEARWRLVETAWDLGISRNHLMVENDVDDGLLFVEARNRRVNVTNTVDALNGYQKGRCFYCFRDIVVQAGGRNTDVDHFFPHALVARGGIPPVVINGVWNLVLACRECNRGSGGKFQKLPAERLLERLRTRNDYLIASHHPLRETLIRQTGNTPRERTTFLRDFYNRAFPLILERWQPEEVSETLF